MRWLLWLPLLLGACGLDDFSWGGPKDACSVQWEMRFVGFGLLDDLRPEVSNVTRYDEGPIAWIASYPYGGEMLRARFRIVGPRLDVQPIEEDAGPPIVASSACSFSTKRSSVRDEPLSVYTCKRLAFTESPTVPTDVEDGFHRHEPGERPPEGELVFQEIDRCPQG